MNSDAGNLVVQLSDLFTRWSHSKVKSIKPLPESGSYRRYYRVSGENGKTVIGVYNKDVRENQAFIQIGKHLLNTGNRVPEIYATDQDKRFYLVEDLGDTTLLDYIHDTENKPDRNYKLLKKYQSVIDAMPGLQLRAYENFDFSVCYPRAEFDAQSIMWDLNYFKYNLLKPLKIHFDEQDLEEDFIRIIAYLAKVTRKSFMFRDFQSRNIMLYKDSIFFIDFQGGRRGPLQYDLASLLFEAKASLDPETRDELVTYYIELFSREFSWFRPEEFLRYFYGFVYLRLMQAMGAYGFRGLVEQKPLFLQSLPRALRILEWLMKCKPLPLDLVSLPEVFTELIHYKGISIQEKESDLLTVNIKSFAYKNGIPIDATGHGGGFVFDCRSLSNPGRNAAFHNLTGLDKPVKDFLANDRLAKEFLSHTCGLIGRAVEDFIKRDFKNLSVCYGCTGGRHRSVYMSERLGEYLKNNYRLHVVIHHIELEKFDDAY